MKDKLILILIMLVVAVAANDLSRREEAGLVFEPVRQEMQVQAVPVHTTPVFLFPIHAEDYIALSSPIGYRPPETVGGMDNDNIHLGLDMFGLWMARICAGANAYVPCVFPAPNGYYRGHDVLGGLVILQVEHCGDTYLLVHGHLSYVAVEEGSTVDAGAFLGRQGDTGKSDGYHLHYGINKGGTLERDERGETTGNIIGGEWLNPLQYLIEPKERI